LGFFEEINKLPTKHECLERIEWLECLAFLVDIKPTGHLNNLNLKLHGNNKLFTNLCNDVASFKMKLELFANQLPGKQFDNFQYLKESCS